ncbi:MAG: glycosyltransferase family 2 protein, partial [Fimbriimonadales bacterium]|nr:glycosyltransferase family 2 protein [Fimbriimonadales bacterium]
APALSLCIVNWNTRELLRACLRSIYQYPPDEPFEVIVVDNASTDGSAEMVRAEFPQVILMANSENRGYARGNNQAMERAQGEFILLLNPDTEMRPNTLRNALRFLREHPEVGAIGAKQLFPDGRVQPSVRGFPTPRNLLFEVLGLARLCPRSRLLAAYRMRWFTYDHPMPVDQPMGTFLMVRRAVLEQVGLMDEAFPLFFNDVDWCYRIWQAGWQIWFVPEVEILHHGGASTRQVRPAAIRESHRALEQFYRKHYRSRLPLPLYAPIIGLIRLSGWLRLLLQPRSSGGPHS